MTSRDDIAETLEAIAFDVREGVITKEEFKYALNSLAEEIEEVGD